MPIEPEITATPVYIVGDNWLAIIVAAVAIYAIGFIIYGAVFSGLWMKLSGYTKEQLQPHMWKMAISWIMPILTAIGLAHPPESSLGSTNLATGLDRSPSRSGSSSCSRRGSIPSSTAPKGRACW
jgi:hypothetical protein